MTTKELINKLKKLPPYLEVIVDNDGYESIIKSVRTGLLDTLDTLDPDVKTINIITIDI